MKYIIGGFIIGIVVVPATVALILIIKNLTVCFWRATDEGREQFKIKILRKLGRIEEIND